jgi:hypothetical protein
VTKVLLFAGRQGMGFTVREKRLPRIDNSVVGMTTLRQGIRKGVIEVNGDFRFFPVWFLGMGSAKAYGNDGIR